MRAALWDRRSWAAADRMRFERVADGPVNFTVTLAAPETTDLLCRPLATVGKYSCYNGSRSVINYRRWRDGGSAYGTDLAAYRIYVINHEVGHALGHDHQFGCLPDGRAPVMMQQTKGTGSCSPNPWPSPSAG
ncbi:MAG: DUF3152 domain-containing protein [Actinomycetota bacterium]|nr:DUF3152 domain-containing protein [Actinomycetota bacterium]